MTRVEVVERFLRSDKDLMRNLRRKYLQLREDESLADKVLEDIIVGRTKEGLEIRYIFK